MVRLELKDDSESASTDGSSNKLIAISVGLVATNLEVREEALYCFLKRNTVGCKFIVFKVIFEIGGNEAMPIYHEYAPFRKRAPQQ